MNRQTTWRQRTLPALLALLAVTILIVLPITPTRGQQAQDTPTPTPAAGLGAESQVVDETTTALPTQPADISLQASVSEVRCLWDADFSGGSIDIRRRITGQVHWLTSAIVSPAYRRLGSWRYGPANNQTFGHYAVVNAKTYEVYEVGIGASDSEPGSDLFNAVGTQIYRVWREGTGVRCELVRTIGDPGTNQPPNKPTLVAPGNGSILASRDVTLQWQDNGDPDNRPWNYRNFGAELLKDGAVIATRQWDTASSWQVTVPGDGTYQWRAMSGDGELGSGWTDMWSFTVQTALPEAIHLETRLRGAVENGTTTIFLQVCGTGQQHRFRTLQLANNAILWDQAYDALNNACSREYRAVINALPGGQFRFYSTVMNTSLPDDVFLTKRRDSCTVMSPGNVRCNPGDTPPPAISPVPPPSPSPSDVPFFWQADPAWRNHPLRTRGACSASCRTIGACGCTLTSAAMIFKYHGANLNPPTLSDCMGNLACPFYWGTGLACSNRYGGRTTSPTMYGFSWERLDQEVNRNRRPVILGMARGNNTHWVVVVRGSGNIRANYIINDPGYKGGAGMRLSAYNSWQLTNIAVYPARQSVSLVQSIIPTTTTQRLLPGLPVSTASSPQNEPEAARAPVNPRLASTITGTILVYQTTDVTMTLELTTSGGDGTEMLIWTDTLTNTTWQPFTQYVEVPVSSWVYAKYRDANGTVSDERRAFSHLLATPPDTTVTTDVMLQSLAITGTTTATLGVSSTFTVTSEPIIATVPITYTWQATDQEVITRTGEVTETIQLTWATPGTKTITVTATNGLDAVTATHQVLVGSSERRVYLPLLRR